MDCEFETPNRTDVFVVCFKFRMGTHSKDFYICCVVLVLILTTFLLVEKMT
jgi:hypothetical protein